MDQQQLINQYKEFCMYHSNPPSFETWKKQQEALQKLSDLNQELGLE